MKLNNKTILLVEDNIATSMMEILMLEQGGYTVLHASSIDIAFDILQNCSKIINLIIMDVDFGSHFEGVSAAKEINNDYNIPIVFVTSYTYKEISDKIKNVPNYGFISKTSSEAEFLLNIKKAFKINEKN